MFTYHCLHDVQINLTCRDRGRRMIDVGIRELCPVTVYSQCIDLLHALWSRKHV